MSYTYCNNHKDKVKMNRLYYNNVRIVEGKKQGAKTFLDCYWCKSCMKIYKVETKQEEIKLLEIKN